MSLKNKSNKNQAQNDLANRIKKFTKDLYYISETDSEISPFTGRRAESVSQEALLAQTGRTENSEVEERNFEEFFKPLLEVQDWFGDEEKKTAARFSKLKELLQKELKDLKVFKVGSIELDVYVVGLDAEGVLTGIKMKAVET
jgi:hypothetical protein